MFVVIDDFFSDDKLNEVVNYIPKLPEGDCWFENNSIEFVEIILKETSKYFDISTSVGYEMHKNVISLGMHYDKDEKLFKSTGQLSFPLCGIVFYPKIEYMTGGEFILDKSAAIVPKTNRLVLFKGDLYHGVIPHTGTRVSIGINPWSEKPLSYRT